MWDSPEASIRSNGPYTGAGPMGLMKGTGRPPIDASKGYGHAYAKGAWAPGEQIVTPFAKYATQGMRQTALADDIDSAMRSNGQLSSHSAREHMLGERPSGRALQPYQQQTDISTSNFAAPCIA